DADEPFDLVAPDAGTGRQDRGQLGGAARDQLARHRGQELAARAAAVGVLEQCFPRRVVELTGGERLERGGVGTVQLCDDSGRWSSPSTSRATGPAVPRRRRSWRRSSSTSAPGPRTPIPASGTRGARSSSGWRAGRPPIPTRFATWPAFAPPTC